MSRRPTIPMLHPRIGASFALIPLSVGVETILIAVAATLDSSGIFGVHTALLYSLLGIVPVLIFYGGSLLIWSPTVEWNSRKVHRTLWVSIALAAFLVGAALAGAFLLGTAPLMSALGISLVAGAVSIYVINRVWYTPAHARDASPKTTCPNCGYDMQGQHDCRCPECGRQYTVGQLVASALESRETQAASSNL